MHVKKYHNLDPEQYKLEHGLKVIVNRKRNCVICGEEFESKSKTKSTCKRACELELYRIETQKKNDDKFKDAIEGVDYVSCGICGYKSVSLSKHLHSAHKEITSEEYVKLYGNMWAGVKLEEMSERIKGENNPAYNHGGKFSPYSKNFIKYEGLTDSEKEEIISGVLSEEGRRSRGNPLRVEYYMEEAGGDVELAKSLLKERQSTFSLKKCIERYGEEEGTKIWKERQDKWLKSFYDRSEEELSDIILRRTSKTKLGGKYIDKPGVGDRPSIVYYLRFYITGQEETAFWKVGITSRGSPQNRFMCPLVMSEKFDGLTYEEVDILECDTLKTAYEIEQKILTKFKDNRIRVDLNGFRTTEAFDRNVLNGKKISEFR